MSNEQWEAFTPRTLSIACCSLLVTYYLNGIIRQGENIMESKHMNLHECLAVGAKAAELAAAGREDDARRLDRTIPIAPWAAKIVKDKLGLEFLLEMDCNMAEVEDAYGKDWLSK
jgi:hypothetical protein